MMLDELIERLWELSRAYGEQEVKMLTQKDAYSWDDHNIDEVIYDSDERAVVIVGKDKTESHERECKDK